MPQSLATHQKNPYSKIYPAHIVKAMEDVVGIPSGPRRWRASAAIWLNLNKVQAGSGLTSGQEYLAVCKLVRGMRDDQRNKFAELSAAPSGAIGGSGVRHGFEMPAGMWAYIKMFDKLAFDKDNPDAKTNLAKLIKEFPELAVAEKY